MRLSDHSCKYFRTNEILNSFLSDVRRYDVPSIEEEEQLIKQYKAGDKSAKDRLIVGNLRFVYSIAKIYARDENEVIDYVNEGVIGLMTALEEFDVTKGCKFLTYGVWYIRRQMNYYMLTKRDLISHSAQVGNISKKSDVIRQKYFAENGSLPSDEDVMRVLEEEFNIKVSKPEDMYDTGIASIDEEVSEDYSMEETEDYNRRTASYNDYEEEINDEYNENLVAHLLQFLPEKAAEIVKMKYGIGYGRSYSVEEISRKFNIAPERIESICEAAIMEMRNVSVSKRVM